MILSLKQKKEDNNEKDTENIITYNNTNTNTFFENNLTTDILKQINNNYTGNLNNNDFFGLNGDVFNLNLNNNETNKGNIENKKENLHFQRNAINKNIYNKIKSKYKRPKTSTVYRTKNEVSRINEKNIALNQTRNINNLK